MYVMYVKCIEKNFQYLACYIFTQMCICANVCILNFPFQFFGSFCMKNKSFLFYPNTDRECIFSLFSFFFYPDKTTGCDCIYAK